MEENNVEEFYWYWLVNIPMIGHKKITKLLEYFHTPYNIYKASKKDLEDIPILKPSDIHSIICTRTDSNIYQEYKSMNKNNISFVTRNSKNYPKRLAQIYDAPYALYYRGSLPEEDKKTVAIIGSRKCSHYGREMAYNISNQLSREGVQIISGLASGIDAMGHRGAIEAGGSTYGVLGCGVDICYPRENIDLYMEMMKNGGVISEYPPKTQPRPGLFPMRNRIISGLSDIIIVVEAREKSGSLITVDQALEQNREIYAVPGRITDELSAGCNNLIKTGAGILTNVTDLYGLLDISPDKTKKTEQFNKNLMLATAEEMLYSDLEFVPKNIDTLMKETGLEYSDILNALISLELKGLIKEVSKNNYSKIVHKDK